MDPENPQEPDYANEDVPILVENAGDIALNDIQFTDETNEDTVPNVDPTEENSVSPISPDFPPPPPPPPPPPEINQIEDAEYAAEEMNANTQDTSQAGSSEVSSLDHIEGVEFTEEDINAIVQDTSHADTSEVENGSNSDASVVNSENNEPADDTDSDSVDLLTVNPAMKNNRAPLDAAETSADRVDKAPEDQNGGHPDYPHIGRPSIKKRFIQHDSDFDEDKHTYSTMCFLCMCMLILASVAVALVGIIWIPMIVIDPTDEIIVDNGGFYSARLQVKLDLEFNNSYYMPMSRAYKELEQEFFSGIENAVSNTEFKPYFYGTIVSGFRPGSIIVHSLLYFVSNTDLLPKLGSLEDKLQISKENGDFGSLVVQTITVNKVSRATNDTKTPIKIANLPSSTMQSISDMNTAILPSTVE